MNSEIIIKQALKYNTLKKDYTNMIKALNKLSKMYKSNIFDKMTKKLQSIDQEFENDRNYKNFLNLLKVGLIEIDELTSNFTVTKEEPEYIENPNRYMQKLLSTSYPSLNELL